MWHKLILNFSTTQMPSNIERRWYVLMARVQDQSVDTANTVLLLINNKYAIGRAQSMAATRSYGTRGVYE